MAFLQHLLQSRVAFSGRRRVFYFLSERQNKPSYLSLPVLFSALPRYYDVCTVREMNLAGKYRKRLM